MLRIIILLIDYLKKNDKGNDKKGNSMTVITYVILLLSILGLIALLIFGYKVAVSR
jgi:hypothetical protein